MHTKVSISNDMAVIVLTTPTCSLHPFAPMPPVPPVPPPTPTGIAFEIPCTVYWPPGELMGKNKLTTTVKHLGLSIAQEGHDCGPMIVHVQIVPASNNMLTPLQVLTSKRKANFSSGEIKANGSPIANCMLTMLPPTPMTSCGSPVAIPGTDTPTAHMNSLLVGIHPVDLIAGWVEVALTLLVEIAQAMGGGGVSPGAFSDTGVIAEQFGSWGRNVRNPSGGSWHGGTGGIAQNAPGIWAGLIRMAGQEFFDYHGDATVAYNLSSGPFRGGVSVARDGLSRDWTIQASEGLNGPMGLGGVRAEERVQISNEGNVTSRLRGRGNLGGLEGNADLNMDESGRVRGDAAGDWPHL